MLTGNRLNPTPGLASINNIMINTNKIDLELVYTNTDGVDTKIGFGMTGGTYDTPTGNYETSVMNITL